MVRFSSIIVAYVGGGPWLGWLGGAGALVLLTGGQYARERIGVAADG